VVRLIIAMIALISWPAHANEGAAKEAAPSTKPSEKFEVTTISEIAVERGEGKTFVNVHTAGSTLPAKLAIEEHGTFLQVLVPNAITTNPGKFIDGAGAIVKKIVTFQSSPNEVSIRLFIDGDGPTVAKQTFVDSLSNRLLLTIDDVGATTAIAATTANLTDTPSASVVPESAVAAAAVTETSKGDLQKKMTNLTVYSAGALFLLLVVMGLRPLIRRRQQQNTGPSEIPAFKTLAVHSLGPKQKIAVVKVGEQRLLLGITPSNISILQNIDLPMTAASAAAPAVPARIEAPRPKVHRPIPGKNISKSAPAPIHEGNETDIQRPRRLPNYRNVTTDDRRETAPTNYAARRLEAEDGSGVATKLSSRAVDNQDGNYSPRKNVEDVTKLLREKLKTLQKST
jgi:flagellar protein FliO/FliZ